jgi:hypothetical protein
MLDDGTVMYPEPLAEPTAEAASGDFSPLDFDSADFHTTPATPAPETAALEAGSQAQLVGSGGLSAKATVKKAARARPAAGTQVAKPKTNIVPMRALSDKDALAWLVQRGRMETSTAALARDWRWGARKVKNHLDRWSLAGEITLKPGLGGRTVIVALHSQEIGKRPETIANALLKSHRQSPAPVRVEERNGRIARVSDRDSALTVAERDFNAWREPVLEHIHELSSSDFRQGTNHGRVRDRLVALCKLLPGSIAEVKERQFRIGYEIERLGGLVSAYRSASDDMPALNAAVSEDLHRLHVALVMGIDKLERWAEFRRSAAEDPRGEGDASPAAISEALDEMATAMEQAPKYFEPKVPETFRFMAEAIRDPMGATKTVVYGGMRSAENVISFLGQRALGIGRNAVEAVGQHISKAVAISLITGFSAAALKISGELPAGWAWLKPLLEALSKAGGM